MAGHFIEDLDLIDKADLTKPLTMIVPAYNEEVTIVDSVTSLVNCDYPRFEVVVVNDGSSDLTLERLKDRLSAAPHRRAVPSTAIATAPVRGPCTRPPFPFRLSVMQLVVIDKENGGKADALNAGINASTTPYFVSLDADSILDQRALKELMRVIQEDPRVVAVGRTGGDRQRLHGPEQPRGGGGAARPVARRVSRWWSISGRSPPAAPVSTGCTPF